MNIFRGLCSHFYNVAQDFVANLEEAAILHDALEGARLKLSAHRESNQTTLVLEDANVVPSQDGCLVGAHELVGPKHVQPRGRPSTTRLGAKRDKTSKKAALKRNNGRNGVEEITRTEQVTSQHTTSFTSLLNSFHNPQQK
ncbi:hypothetical protein PIB30_021121, partial [Stylosanthes scabra]|nr:hypothetical protein [Stylosanthes scabra]